jgi:hypothetical protein
VHQQAVPQVIPVKEPKVKATPRTPQLASLLKGENKSDLKTTAAQEVALADPFTEAQLRQAWEAFAEQRKKFQAEFQMLSQPYQLQGNTIVVELLSPVHETMLNNIKGEVTAFLREQLRNNTIQVTGQLLTGESKKIIYTNREKFDYLVEKNPMLRELKDRLGLDTDF